MPTVVPLESAEALDLAQAALDRGELIVVPTDTVYGLAARADVRGVAEAVFAAKDRPPDVPLAVLVADEGQAVALLDDLPEWAEHLMGRFWPGPLTLVARRRRGVRLDLGGPTHTIGVRCPDHPFIRALARRVGPVATTSANRHGRPTPETAREVADHLAAALPATLLIIDGGRCAGAPSTVVDVTGDAPVILRPGTVDPLAETGRGAE